MRARARARVCVCERERKRERERVRERERERERAILPVVCCHVQGMQFFAHTCTVRHNQLHSGNFHAGLR